MPFASGVFSLVATNPVVTGTTISSTWANNTLSDIASNGLSLCVLKDGSQTITANIPMNSFKLTGLAAGSASGNSLRYEQVNGVVTTVGDLLQATGAGAFTRVAFGTKGDLLVGQGSGVGAAQAVGSNGTSPVADSNQTNGLRYAYPAIRSYLSGCTLSTAGSSTTMSIAAGSATDSTNVDMMVLSAIAKTTGSWAVGTGNGGLDTGSIASGTWYHFYVIKRVDTGVVDVLFSTSASAPTMPANYTLKRRIGSGKTDGSSNWTLFAQVGDYFILGTPVQDISVTSPGTSAVTRTLASVPTGVQVRALINSTNINTGTAELVYISDLASADLAPSSGSAPGANISSVSNNLGVSQLEVMTNTSAQIRSRNSTGDGNTTFKIHTLGWTDRRGRDS